MSMSINSVALVAELEVIKQWLKKNASLSETTEVELDLPQSQFFLKVLDVPYKNSNTSLPIISVQITAALSSSPLFEGILTSLYYIIKTSLSSDISEYKLTSRTPKEVKSRIFINCSFNFE